jgi:hypothetical protein
MFPERDILQIKSLGISLETIAKQIHYFRAGFPYIKLDRPATIDDGILKFDDPGKEFFIDYFNRNSGKTSFEKFVPASGAASRMFKDLFGFRENYYRNPNEIDEYLNNRKSDPVIYFFQNLEKFAFYKDLCDSIESGNHHISDLLMKKEFGLIIDYLLSDKGLGYSALPKALLKFHEYQDGSRVAFEEHLVEAALYASGEKGPARIHFTLSPEHIEKFRTKLGQVVGKYQDLFHVDFQVTYSIQEKSTDTIAVDEYNEPFRNPSGELLFRPGGHGALLDNLNKIDTDIIFIKNIDNIVPDRLKGPTVEYKKLIGGYLLYVRDIIFEFLKKSENSRLTEEDVIRISAFLKDKLFFSLPEDFPEYSLYDKIAYLTMAIDRPIRVCGMVKNEGEPGGGPFWVIDKAGTRSLQIVESSQVDPGDEDQKKLLNASTHFNPVDLVCSIRNYKGEIFNLENFVDPDTGFIAFKSTGGKVIKAQELPGLWNGAMAKWITIFADVPVITFNPVKTVNDLLRKEHQPY